MRVVKSFSVSTLQAKYFLLVKKYTIVILIMVILIASMGYYKTRV